MEEEFVTYDIAKDLKYLGFDKTCFKYYNCTPFGKPEFCLYGKETYRQFISNNRKVIAPLWQQAIDFLKIKGVLVTELWDGWEIGLENEDNFTYYPTKKEAVEQAIKKVKSLNPNL